MNNIIKAEFFNQNQCNEIIKYAENKKRNLLNKKYDDIKKTSYYDSNLITTSCYNRYNFLIDNPKFADMFAQIIKNKINNIFWPIAVQAWVNIYETDEGISVHNHSGDFSINVFLGGEINPGICYIVDNEIITIPNKIGEIHIFNSNLKHFVLPNKSRKKRYTIGMCIYQFNSLTDFILKGSCINSKFKEIALLTEPN